MMYLYCLILILLFHNYLIPINSKELYHHKYQNTTLHFFGKEFSYHKWHRFQRVIDCFASNGTWSRPSEQPFLQSFVCKTAYGHRKCYNYTVNYEWNVLPKLCHPKHNYESFDSYQFFQMMKGHHMLFVGDSLSGTMSSSLLSLLHLNTNMSCNICPMFCKNNYEYNPNDFFSSNRLTHFKDKYQPSALHFDENLLIGDYRNDRLSLTTQDLWDHPNKFVENSWINATIDYPYDVFVLNRGSHYENTTIVLDQINLTMNYLLTLRPNATIIWRNTAQGHTDQQQQFDAMPLLHPLPVAEDYHWHLMIEQNHIIRHYLAEYFPSVLYLDVFPSTALRIDAHADGLHYCANGPLNNWVKLLYNALLLAYKSGI